MLLLEEFMLQRKEVLLRNTELIKRRMEKYPLGSLKINKEKSAYYYCIFDNETREKRYVKKNKINEVKKIAQRDYERDYLKIAEKELCDLERLLSKNYSDKAKQCFSDLHPGRKQLVKPFEVTDEEYKNSWMDNSFTPKSFSDDDSSDYYTEKGERVRSKSEVIIANTLYSLQIPYKYECPLILGAITIYPDFTILDVKRRREVYLEHFGMVGDSEYASNMMLKISTFEKHGIYVGDKLICSFESNKRPLNINVLRDKLKTLIL